MSSRDRTVIIGAFIGGLFGAAIAYVLGPSCEPGEEETSLVSSIGTRDAVSLLRTALAFIQQLTAIRQRGPR
jgi:hypothetical protein